MRLRRTGVRKRKAVSRVRMPRKFRRTGLRHRRAIGTQINVSAAEYFNITAAGSLTPAFGVASYGLGTIMQKIITQVPNFTNMTNAYEYVALKKVRISWTCTGITNVGNASASANYPTLHSAMYYDSYGQVSGLGGQPALVLSRLPGATSAIGRCRMSKVMYGYPICKKVNLPYWQPTATGSGSYYVPAGIGSLPYVTIGVNTIDGTPYAGNPVVGLIRIHATLSFKNMKE